MAPASGFDNFVGAVCRMVIHYNNLNLPDLPLVKQRGQQIADVRLLIACGDQHCEARLGRPTPHPGALEPAKQTDQPNGRRKPDQHRDYCL
jgi:hypothetical protein